MRSPDRSRTALLLLILATLGGCQTISLAQLFLQERQYAEDRLIEAQISGEFAADPLLADSEIDVDVYLKQVTLHGAAGPGQALRAVAIAEAVPLVDGVTSRLHEPVLR